MMKIKQIIFSTAILLIVGLFSSCEYFVDKKIEPVSTLTTNPIFVLTNGEVMTWEIGKPWVEPGYACSEVEAGKTDLNSTVVIDASEVDVNTRGLYQISYTATNSYGYVKTVYRNVLVTSGVSDLYDISGKYYIGFFPVDDNTMKIEPAEVPGFWKVGNINNKSNVVEGYIADLGDKTYIVAKSLFKRKVSNLRYVYLKGDAIFDSEATEPNITFTLTEVYDDDVELAAPKSYKWKKYE